MKKIFALILALLLLLPLVAACGDKPEESSSNPKPSTEDSSETTSNTPNDSSTGENSTTDTNTDSDTTSTSTDTGKPDFIDPEKEILDTWNGKTLNILATIWNTSDPNTPSYPWSVAELCATKRDDDSNYGASINNAILERADFIKNTYGVTLNWIGTSSNSPMSLALELDKTEGRYNYNIAMPRMLDAQSLALGGYVYDMAKSAYIDFSKPYFNQMAYESYTVSGHTLFAAGDFSFLDEQTSFMIFYNKELASKFQNFPDVYEMVRQGAWTIDRMYKLAAAAGADDGDGVYTNNDQYGFAGYKLNMFYQYFGIQQVSVNPELQEYEITLDDDKVGTVIDKILVCLNAKNWARFNWSGDGPGLTEAFVNGKVLFLNEVIQNFDIISPNMGDGVIDCGFLPFPMLDEEQGRYYTPVSYQSVVICIPKTTDDRDMSEYFVSVLSYTGKDYVMDAYLSNITVNVDTDSEEMLNDYIFANMIYDQGYMYSWNGLLTDVQERAYSSGTNIFATVYGDSVGIAKEEVNSWNEAWGAYSDRK